jgi:carboxyl-terminal processing protease
MRIFLTGLAVLTALVAGIYIGANPDTPVVGVLKTIVAPDKAQISADQARDLIRDEYIRKVPGSTLTDGSISGMVKALKDPYTHYFDPQQNKMFEQVMSGKYSGVGMAVNGEPRGLLVTFVYRGSPANRAKMRTGDVITKVNGKSIAGMPADAAVARIKGPEGTSVTLTVRTPRDSAGKKLGAPRDLKLQRKQIEIPITSGRLIKRNGRKTGVVALTTFTETAGAAVAREIARLKKKGADSYVLDLRGNGGGRLDQAVAVVSLFLSKGMIVATDGRARLRHQYDAIKGAVLTADPLVVLVDRGSASASEIVSGALKYRNRALIVGTRTYGKGVFQEVTDFNNGGALSLTVGRYELPGKHYITKTGLTPDLKAKDDPKTHADEALNASLAALAAFKK